MHNIANDMRTRYLPTVNQYSEASALAFIKNEAVTVFVVGAPPVGSLAPQGFLGGLSTIGAMDGVGRAWNGAVGSAEEGEPSSEGEGEDDSSTSVSGSGEGEGESETTESDEQE